MKVLLTCGSLRPEFGGPAVSVPALAAALSTLGADVGLWSADNSAPTDELTTSCTILGGTLVRALKVFGRPDICHDNGIWSPFHHELAAQMEIQGVPRIVAPRGMLEPWARRSKRLKKIAAWFLYQKHDLQTAAWLQATSAQERDALLDLRLKTPIKIVPNGVALPRSYALHSENAPTRHALFMGRIDPKKGLLTLVAAWARVRPPRWHLNIVGPDYAGHRADVERTIAALGVADSVSVRGLATGPEKDRNYIASDVVVLPSFSENFGMTVAEALAYKIPVITTTATPWEVLHTLGCGWWVRPDVNGITDALAHATSLSPTERRSMGEKGFAYVSTHLSWSTIAHDITGLYMRR